MEFPSTLQSAVLAVAIVSAPPTLSAATLLEFDRIGDSGQFSDGNFGSRILDPGGIAGGYRDFGSSWIQTSHGLPASTGFRPASASFVLFGDVPSASDQLASQTLVEWHYWIGEASFAANPNTPDFVALSVPVNVSPLGMSSTGLPAFRYDLDLSEINTSFTIGEQYLMGVEVLGVAARVQDSDLSTYDGINDDWGVAGDNGGFFDPPETLAAVTGGDFRNQAASLVVEAIPEPSATLLLLITALGVLSSRRR